jgi:glutamyl-tRNA reductase
VKTGVTAWRVSNRTTANAQVVADLIGGNVVNFPPSVEDVAWADLIITATSSSDPVIGAKTVASALKIKKDIKLFLDLAVPRDVDAKVRDLSNTYVYSVDDFKEMVASSLKVREQEALRAEKLILKQVKDFADWYKSNRISPAIQQLQEVLESIRVREVEKNLHFFSDADHEQIELFSRNLMKKVTNHIISNLRHATPNGDDIKLAKALSQVLVNEDEENLNEVLEKLDYELSH